MNSRRGYRRLPTSTAPDVQREVDDELAFHLEMRARELEEAGWPPRAARLEARRLFGDLEDVRGRCHRIETQRVDEERGGHAMDALRQDLGYAVRSLTKYPSFAAIAVATLALGIGANTAIFSVVNGVLLHPLPYPEADRIVRAWTNQFDQGVEEFSFRVIEHDAFLDEMTSLSALGGDFPIGLTVTGGGSDPERIVAALTTPGYFEVFDARPVLGRTFTAEEIRSGTAALAVVTHDFWIRRFAGDSAAVGETVLLDNEPFVLLGVLPANFFPIDGDTDVFIPYNLGTASWIGRWLSVYGRLAPGASVERAEEEMNAVLARMGESERRSAGWTVTMESLHRMVVGDVRPALFALFGTVGLVLLIACANVANLALARTATREREIVVRMALGAGRGRIVRQVLVESVVLSAVGGLAGVILAMWGVRALIALAPPTIPRLGDVGIDAIVLTFTFGVSVVAGVAFGLAPALHASRSTMGATLRRHSRSAPGGRHGHRILGGLVVSEVALALVLLVGAGLMVKSFASLQRQEVGVDRANVASVRVALPIAQYPDDRDRAEFFTRLEERLASTPGVVSVGSGSDLPLSGRGAIASINAETRWRAGTTDRVAALQRVVTAGFFSALRIPLRAGRFFELADADRAPDVVIVGETLASQLWPGEDPIGQRVTSSRNPTDDSWREVIGVVGDVRYRSMEDTPQAQFYEYHHDRAWNAMHVVLRAAGDPSGLFEIARREVHGFDPNVPVYETVRLEEVVGRALAGQRFNMWLFGAFGLIALALASAGIYGVLSFTVTRRNHEIGLRMAMGAPRSAVIGLVVRRGMTLVATGALIGMGAAVAATRIFQSLLYTVSTTDVATYLTMGLILGSVALAASYLPALRASRVDPVTVLREE